MTISKAMALDGSPWMNVMGLVAWGLTLVLPVVLKRFGSVEKSTDVII